MPDSDWWQVLWPNPADTMASVAIEPGTPLIVDLCCGDGLFTGALARLALQVIAIDLDPKMIACASANLAELGAKNCEFVLGDAYDLAAVIDQPVDLVLMANTFHGVPEKGRLAKAVAAALKPDGRFIVINWHRRPREETTVLGQPRGPGTGLRMEPRDVAAAVHPASLELTRLVELPPYHYAAIFMKTSA
ncbi:MAG TPA: class I SAM-dependent methyltransferase [Stellaceae bacterium]